MFEQAGILDHFHYIVQLVLADQGSYTVLTVQVRCLLPS
jgi:hypothetical protein